MLAPVLYLALGLFFDYLGANPIENILHSLGEWALVILILCLSLSPISRILKWAQLIQLRRMFGLFAFLYALLHFLSYFGFEQGFELGLVLDDLWDRPFIAVGFAAFIIIFVLATTSTQKKRRQMGVHWKTVHRFVYLAVILSVIHFWWLVKADVKDPILYAFLVTLVLLERVWYWSKRKYKPRK